MGVVSWIARKEFAGYFVTPIALVFLLAFQTLTICAMFFWGDFFILNEASLRSYFYWLPFVFVAFVPAVGMRLWSEERRQHTLELLLTMPVSPCQAVMGKYLAGVAFLAVALALSFPLCATVLFLGEPDIGVMSCGYFGSLLLSGVMLAICSLLSSLTANQVISYVSGVVVCLFLVLGGHQSAMLFMREWVKSDLLVRMLGALGAGRRFETFQRGVLDLGDCVYFVTLAVVFLMGTVWALNRSRR